MLKVIMSLTFLIFSTNSIADENLNLLNGWGNTEWGMSVNEVYELEFNRATLLESPVIYTSADDSAGWIKISDLNISHEDFEAVFIFYGEKNDELEAVILKATAELLMDQHRMLFNDLEFLLTRKYGSPSYKSPKASPDDIIEINRTAWDFDKTTILLQHRFLPYIDSSTLQVIYLSTKLAEDETDLL
jgi:hypothetical protein